MYGQGLIKGLGITLKHFFEKDITVQYPEEMPFLQERFRGCLNFDFMRCIACGICVNTCPNNVINMETVKDENTKKKKLMKYTIDMQYCMFCNMCVENCPKNCLYFDQNFELSQFDREEIIMVYNRPEELDNAPAAAAVEKTDEAEGKKQKKIAAMHTGLLKNPQKLLAKILDTNDEIEIMVSIIQNDEKKAGKIAQLMVEDQEKARKIATAFVNHERKLKSAKEESGEEGISDVS